jgi:pimeloyl-ACP methyl ester carboxylesterase
MGDEEKLPIMDGVRKNDMVSVVRSVFHRPRFVDRDIVRYYRAQHANRKWRKGLLRTVSGTLEHTVRERMKDIKAQTLLVTGEQDQVCDPKTAEVAAREMAPGVGHFLSIPNCGHAPQIEKHWLINRLVVHFLTAPNPTAHPKWTQLLLAKPTRAAK